MSKFKIVGLGEVLWDVFPDVKKLGGAPANFAYHCNKQGAEAYVVSSIGKDDEGKELINKLSENDLYIGFVQESEDYPTGKVTVDLDFKGTPKYVIHENVAWDYIKEEEKLNILAKEIDAVCFGTLAQRGMVSRHTIHNFLKKVPEDALRVFDVNLRQIYYSKTMIKETLEHTDVLKLNNEELPIVADVCDIKKDGEDSLKCLMEQFDLKLIAYTKGPEGSYLITKDETSFQSPMDVDVVDTVGAGDAFTAAIIIGLLKEEDLKKIHEHANRLASYVCTKKGAMPKIPKEYIY